MGSGGGESLHVQLDEAKAGAAATIASPALDFGRHAQSVQDLVLKAYKQCERFFSYLNSALEVPLFHLVNGKYVECGRGFLQTTISVTWERKAGKIWPRCSPTFVKP